MQTRRCKYCGISQIHLDANGVCYTCAIKIYPDMENRVVTINNTTEKIYTAQNPASVAKLRDEAIRQLEYLQDEYESKGIKVLTTSISFARKKITEVANKRVLHLLTEKLNIMKRKTRLTNEPNRRVKLYKDMLETVIHYGSFITNPKLIQQLRKELLEELLTSKIREMIQRAEKHKFLGNHARAKSIYLEAIYEIENSPVSPETKRALLKKVAKRQEINGKE